MSERVKVYEENKKAAGLPLWAWLLPLLLLLGLLAYFLSRHRDQPAAAPTSIPATEPTSATTAPARSAFPDLGAVHFETNKATLTAADQATLDRAAAAMKADPSAHMRLEGYTDSTGTLPKNQTLSQQRAFTVAQYLKEKGIDGKRLTGDGFGPANPVDTNATASGKADNRRVELFSQK